jgi:DNA-binding beta-propeller fold protein YncE
MDSQRLHMRSTVFVTQDLLEQLPDVSPEFELEVPLGQEARIVANRIVVAGGTLRGHRLSLIADSITTLDPGASIALGLVNQTAPNQFNGRAGHPLTVVAARLDGGAGTSRGQQGGKGKKGRDGVEMPPIPQPDHEPDDPQGPPELEGRDGEKGGQGFKGGDGGPVTVILMAPSAHTAKWLGLGGLPGEGGDGGIGEPVFGEGDGDPGDPGDPGAPGDDRPASVQIVDLAGFRQGVSQALVLGDWALFRQQLAVEEFRRENFAVALDELDAAQRLIASQVPSTLASELPALVRDNRSATGVARDQDLVPDIANYAGKYQEAAKALHDAIGDVDGFVLFADPTGEHPDRVADRLAAIKAALGGLIASGGEFTTQKGELVNRAEAALKTINALRARTFSALTRLDALLGAPGADPSIALPGQPPLDAHAIAAGLADVLGAKDPSAAPTPAAGTVLILDCEQDPPFHPELDPVTLLPADLDLLVHRSVRNRRIVTTGEAGTIADRAAGLARLADWPRVAANAVDAEGVPVAVDLGLVADDLRAADGDAAVLDQLVELAEISHVWRLARARAEQLLAGWKTLCLQMKLADRESKKPNVEPHPADLIPGLRCLLDALSWRAEQADRAADILTFGLTRPAPAEIERYPARPEVGAPLARLAPVIHAPDWQRDLRESTPGHIDALGYDLILSGLITLDHNTLYDDYLDRGIALVGDAPPSVVREFHKAERPDVFARFASGAGNLWLDVTTADVAGEKGTIPHRETRVVGIKVSLEFEESAPPEDVTLLATHTGLSVQRDMAGAVHRQQMLPAAVEVVLTIPTNGGTQAFQMLEGEARVDQNKKIDFAAYGRGAAAGWLIAKADNTVELDGLQTIRVEVFYEGIVPKGTVSLRSVSSAPAALRVGAELPIHVRLTAPAGPGGAPVFVSSSDPSVIKTPGTIAVAAGQLEAVGLASVVGASGGLPPTISARTADGVTRRVRPIVPKPSRPLTESARLAPAELAATVSSVLVLPGDSGLLATVIPGPDTPGGIGQPGLLHHRSADLASVRQAEIGAQPRSLAFDPQRKRIYVAHSDPRNLGVSMLDAGTLQTLAEQRVGGMLDIQVDVAAGLVYTSRFNPGLIEVLSADDLSPVAQITDADGRLRRLHGMAVVPGADGGAHLYVARIARGVENEESALTQIRRQPDGSHTVVRSLRFAEVGTQPIDVAVDPVHNMIFVACLGGGGVPAQLIVLEHPTMNELGRVRLLSTGRAVATRPGSAAAHVVGEAGLMVIDGASCSLVSRVQTGGFPLAVAVDPVSGTTHVGRRDDATVVRVDAPTSAAPTFW